MIWEQSLPDPIRPPAGQPACMPNKESSIAVYANEIAIQVTLLVAFPESAETGGGLDGCRIWLCQ